MIEQTGTSGEPGAKGTGTGGTGGAGGTGGIGETGARGERGRRGATGSRDSSWSEVVRTFWLFLLSVFLIVFVLVTFDRFEREGAERRDQSCTIAEREHKADVDELRRTYEALTDPSQRELLPPGLFKLVLQGLPAAEIKAGGRPPNRDGKVYFDPAPAFCDEPGVGLPEPDPTLPRRPAGLTVPKS